MRYQRADVTGGTYFFTVNLAERKWMKIELGARCARLESGLINLAAMVNHMNRYGVLNRIRGVKHAPITNTNAELEQTRKRPCQRFGLDLIEMLGEPLDLFGYASGDCSIKVGEVLKRLRGELNLIGQARFSLLFTSSNGMRSWEARDAWSRAWISPVSSSPLSGSVIRSCNSSRTTFLISVCNSSTVRSATFMMLSIHAEPVRNNILIVSDSVRPGKRTRGKALTKLHLGNARKADNR
jgi:hypothetical protein